MKIDSNSPVLSGLDSLATGSVAVGRSSITEIGRERTETFRDRTSFALGGAALDAATDVRHDQVERLRATVASGTYKLEPAKIATAMVADHFGPAFAR